MLLHRSCCTSRRAPTAFSAWGNSRLWHWWQGWVGQSGGGGRTRNTSENMPEAWNLLSQLNTTISALQFRQCFQPSAGLIPSPFFILFIFWKRYICMQYILVVSIPLPLSYSPRVQTPAHFLPNPISSFVFLFWLINLLTNWLKLGLWSLRGLGGTYEWPSPKEKWVSLPLQSY